MGASGTGGRHAKRERTGQEGQAGEGQPEETAGTEEEQIKYPGQPTAGGQDTGTSASGGEEEQIKYPG